MGLERPFYLFVLSAGMLNVLLAVFLVPRYGAIGMAISVMMAELFVTGCLVALFKKKGRIFRIDRARARDGGMTPSVTVDIVLCVYNGERFIAEQIRSIQSQTYRDWRLWIRDDGSSDDSLKVARQMAAEEGPNSSVSAGRTPPRRGPRFWMAPGAPPG